MPVIPQAGLAQPQARQGGGFIGTLGEIARLKTIDLQQRKAELELSDYERQRKQEAEMQAALAEAGDDPAAIISVLNRYNPKMAADVSKAWQDGQKAALDAEKTALENENARLDLGGRLFRAFDDLDPADPKAAELYQAIQPAIARIAGPDLAPLIPEQYTPEIVPGLRNVLADADAYNKAREASVKAYETGDRLRAMALRYSVSTTPEQWQEVTQLGRYMGVPKEDLAIFGEFSPENVAKAKELAISPEKQAELAGQAEGRALTARGQDITVRGQDLSAATQRRGQDISASTQRRGQDVSAARAQAGADDSTQNLAALVARSPDVLQGMTPTLAGKVLSQLASDPELMAEYEQTRMAPLRERSQSMLDAINKLVTPDQRLTPGARRIFGEYTPVSMRDMIPGQEATDANAALQQVLGQQIVDLISDMKAQSRTGATGFGQLSVRELEVLQSAATQLTRRLSEKAALKELLAIQQSLQKIMAKGGGSGAAPAGTPERGVATGLTPPKNPAQNQRWRTPGGQIAVWDGTAWVVR